jgi:hypothetical protein
VKALVSVWRCLGFCFGILWALDGLKGIELDTTWYSISGPMERCGFRGLNRRVGMRMGLSGLMFLY